MTGPEHYRKAERLLLMPSPDEGHIAKAQVHATLALAAATAFQPHTQDLSAEYQAWTQVAAVQKDMGKPVPGSWEWDEAMQTHQAEAENDGGRS